MTRIEVDFNAYSTSHQSEFHGSVSCHTQSSLFVFVCILIYFLFVDFGSYLYFMFMKLYKLV